LRAFGFDPGPIDGIYTAQTQAAVRAFQATYGFSVSGLLDRQTPVEAVKVGRTPSGVTSCSSLQTVSNGLQQRRF